MKELHDRVAVVTGGASGIGRALAVRLAREGMKVMIGDVEQAALDGAVSSMRADGLEVSGHATDVSSMASVESLAEATLETYGGVHLLCNNAGIGTDETRTMLWDSAENDWRWALGVNVWGVLHGIRAFVPLMLQRGEEGHVVNTSSGNGGLVLIPTTPIYATTKAAVTTLTESLHHQLAMTGSDIKVSVLFPGPHVVNTGIFQAARNRPAALVLGHEPAAPPPSLDDLRKMAEQAGMEFAVTEPDEVAEYAVEGIRSDRFWILPPSEDMDARIRARAEGIVARRNPTLG